MKVARVRRGPQPRLTSPFGVGGTAPMPALDDLSDVDTTGVADGDTIVFDDGTDTWVAGSAGSSGTVTSVALTVPAEFTVSGSPITTSGTLAVSKANESANTVWAGPTTGAAAAPTFRSLVAADLPSATSIWVPVMTEDASTGFWYVAVTGDGDAIMTEVPL